MLIEIGYVVLWGATIGYLLHGRSGQRWLGQLASITTLISTCILIAGLVQRGVQAGHWPLSNRYEVALCIGSLILVIYLLIEVGWHERRAGALVLLFSLLSFTFAFTRPQSERLITPLLPALRSIWLQLHVLTTLIGYAAFGVAAGIALTRLLQTVPLEGEERVWLPSGVNSEAMMERVVALGFPWLSLGILTGAIWAQNAWGRYWGWDPKETWTLITWLWYLLILHVRTLRNWRGPRLAALIVAGCFVVIFTYIGVPWLVRTVRLESLHGF
ncbi:MAG: cytochrome c biogenesis protein CcsA [Anaerolineaceae bacterium]|nr:MAG: cytochrome c biogenesis protein CcsA [Anaerolineaceae bacterium]